MLTKTFKPSEMLKDYVECYWVLDSDASDGDVSCRVTPIGTIEVMFHYKKTFRVSKSGMDDFYQPHSFISGISSSFVDVTANSSGVIVACFHPFGAYNFFDFPLIEIENGIVDLNLICAKELRIVEDRLSCANTINKRIKIVEEFLTGRLQEKRSEDVKLIRAGIEQINKSKGQLSANELAQKLNVIPKQLERKFSSVVGKTPKQFIKIVRFNNVLNTLTKKPSISLTNLAYDYGYFDQSHLIKEFKTFSGYTPSEFVSLYPCP